MDYLAIIKRAWHIAWHHKFLWLFGFFAAGISGASFNFSWPSNQTPYHLSESEISQFSQQIGDFFSKYWFVFVFLGLVFLLIFLVFFVLNIVSHGALISCVSKLNEGKLTDIKDGFGIGFSKFWKVFGLRLVFGILIFLALLVLVGPVVALFVLKMYGRSLILLIFALIIFLPLAFIVSFVILYAIRFIVLKDLAVFESIKSGFNLLKDNILPSIVVFLILAAVSLAVGIAFFVIFLFVFIPLLLFVLLGAFLGGVVGGLFVGVPAALLLIFFSAITGAIYNTFSSSLWTLAFLEMERKMGP